MERCFSAFVACKIFEVADTQVTDTLNKGGRVLVPVFTQGNAQELILLLQQHWEKHGLQVDFLQLWCKHRIL